jgi:hypothetical protein
MKRKSLMFLSMSGLFAILGAGVLHAQTRDHLIKANVPFRFVIGNQAFPAGAYKVTRIGDQGVIKNDDAKVAAILTTDSTSFNQPQKHTVLRFNRVGDEYFLSQLWEEGAVSGEELPPSKMERELTKAQNAVMQDDLVLVAGQ